MEDDFEFLIQFLPSLAVLGLFLCIFVSLSKKFEIAALEWGGVPVVVLTAANLVVSFKYGLPFKEGHSLEGLLFLLSGVVVNLFTYVYRWNQKRNGNEVDKKFAVMCEGCALYIEIWGMGVLGADVYSIGWTLGNIVCVVVAAISLLYSVGTYFWSSVPWGKLGELLGNRLRQSEDTVGLLGESIELAEIGPGSGTLMDDTIHNQQ